MKRYAGIGSALLLDVVGGALVLLVAARTWQTITTARPNPLPDDLLDVSGRTADSAPTALALVALAGVVAVLATRGVARRLVGAALAVAGGGIAWRAVTAAGGVGVARARELVRDRHPTVDVSGAAPVVHASAGWPTVTAVAGALVAVSGALVLARGHRWQAMSARYETAPAAAAPHTDAPPDVALWTALDRGEDPTG